MKSLITLFTITLALSGAVAQSKPYKPYDKESITIQRVWVNERHTIIIEASNTSAQFVLGCNMANRGCYSPKIGSQYTMYDITLPGCDSYFLATRGQENNPIAACLLSVEKP